MKGYFSKFKELKGNVSQELSVASKRIVIIYDELLFDELPPENSQEYNSLRDRILAKESEAGEIANKTLPKTPGDLYNDLIRESRALAAVQDGLVSRVVKPTCENVKVYAAGDYILTSNGSIREYDPSNKEDVRDCMKALTKKALMELESIDNRDVAEILLYADAEFANLAIARAKHMSDSRRLAPEQVRVFTPARDLGITPDIEIVIGNREDFCQYLQRHIPKLIGVEMTEDCGDRDLDDHLLKYIIMRQSQ
jgi:hypothetical protein